MYSTVLTPALLTVNCRISVANLVLLVFLALKNTPLAPLTAKSYEKLRPLHKVAGYTCIFTSIMHAIVYLACWSQTGKLAKMEERNNFAGAIAGMAMLIIAFSTITYFMRRYYESRLSIRASYKCFNAKPFQFSTSCTSSCLS